MTTLQETYSVANENGEVIIRLNRGKSFTSPRDFALSAASLQYDLTSPCL